jgi:hypothetical protein
MVVRTPAVNQGLERPLRLAPLIFLSLFYESLLSGVVEQYAISK